MRKATLGSLAALLVSAQAFAQDTATVIAATPGGIGDRGLLGLGLAIMLGLAAFGATFGQSRVGASAMEGLARNPQARNSMFVPMIVVLALIESLFILTWVLAFLMNNKI